MPRRAVRVLTGARLASAIAIVGTLAVAACGGSCGQGRRVDADNRLPFGFVEWPPGGISVGWRVVVAGWALDDQGVAQVRIFLDDRMVATAAPDIPRPDVAKSFPQFAAANLLPGWRKEIEVPQGSHTIVVQAVDRLGLSRDIGVVPVMRIR